MKKNDIAREYIEKYTRLGIQHKIGYSKRAIARILTADHPDLFPTFERARAIINTVTGSHGDVRRVTPDWQYFQSLFSMVPDSIKENQKPIEYYIPEFIKKTLWINDLHSRFMDRGAFEEAINIGLKNNVDSVIINGDFMDFYRESKFDKNPAISDYFYEEQEWGVEILSLLQNMFHNVFLKKGNHDVRRERYIQSFAQRYPEFLGLSDYEDYLFYEGSTIKFIEDYQVIKYGKLNGIHGHEYRVGGIHTAHNRLHKTFDNTISGHSHKWNSTVVPKIGGNLIGSWAVGCLCNLNPAYAPMNDWTHGCALTEKDTEGDFNVDNKLIRIKNRY